MAGWLAKPGVAIGPSLMVLFRWCHLAPPVYGAAITHALHICRDGDKGRDGHHPPECWQLLLRASSVPGTCLSSTTRARHLQNEELPSSDALFYMAEDSQHFNTDDVDSTFKTASFSILDLKVL
ncbi:hypothetical protein E2C01_051131 [Portunus trituberculatus]|uniref:Uncharacterized protein n=1 Tax=Portunus trituberculatus TaxID=210409 RepID=A0A5B7GHS4_PORTR|nr:hypothetical protein [Portunus trituberculatus]